MLPMMILPLVSVISDGGRPQHGRRLFAAFSRFLPAQPAGRARRFPVVFVICLGFYITPAPRRVGRRHAVDLHGVAVQTSCKFARVALGRHRFWRSPLSCFPFSGLDLSGRQGRTAQPARKLADPAALVVC